MIGRVGLEFRKEGRLYRQDIAIAYIPVQRGEDTVGLVPTCFAARGPFSHASVRAAVPLGFDDGENFVRVSPTPFQIQRRIGNHPSPVLDEVHHCIHVDGYAIRFGLPRQGRMSFEHRGLGIQPDQEPEHRNLQISAVVVCVLKTRRINGFVDSDIEEIPLAGDRVFHAAQMHEIIRTEEDLQWRGAVVGYKQNPSAAQFLFVDLGGRIYDVEILGNTHSRDLPVKKEKRMKAGALEQPAVSFSRLTSSRDDNPRSSEGTCFP